MGPKAPTAKSKPLPRDHETPRLAGGFAFASPPHMVRYRSCFGMPAAFKVAASTGRLTDERLPFQVFDNTGLLADESSSERSGHLRRNDQVRGRVGLGSGGQYSPYP